jgi:putative ABC transport system permease protein
MINKLLMALGATPSSILLLIVKANLRVIGTAILAGLFVGAIATRTLTTLLYEVSASDLSIYLGVCAVAFAVALLATCVSAARAAAIDPVQALRKD